MHKLAASLRKEHTASEDILWQKNSAIANLKDANSVVKIQSVHLWLISTVQESSLWSKLMEKIHESQRDADMLRQEIIESLGVRFIPITAGQVEQDLPSVLALIRSAFTRRHKI